MLDEHAFMDKCLADPDHDLPKLVFADWLEEQGRTIEAWRIRQYVCVYQPEWLAAIRWDHIVDHRACSELVKRCVHARTDDLWRLVSLALLEAVQTSEPLPLDQLSWQAGWQLDQFLQTLAVSKCRIRLYACGLGLPLIDVWDAVWHVQRHALQFHDRNLDPVAHAAWCATTAVRHTASHRKWTRAEVFEATCRAVIRPREDAWAAPSAGDPILSAGYSLWSHVWDTDPTW